MKHTQYAVQHGALPRPVALTRIDAELIVGCCPGSVLVSRTRRPAWGVRGPRMDSSDWAPVNGSATSAHELAKQPLDLPMLYRIRFNGGDAEGLAGLYEDGAVLVTNHAGDVTTGEGLKAELEKAVGDKTAIEIRSKLVGQTGDLALLASRWTITGPDEAETSGRSTDVCRRGADGGWRYVIDNPYGAALR